MWIWGTVAAQAGVWVNEPGYGYAQATVGHQQASMVHLADGSRVPQYAPAVLGHISPLFDSGRYSANDLSLYGEYGVTNNVEFVGSVPVRLVANRWGLALGTYPDIVHRNIGLGDLDAGVRFGKVVRGVALSVLATTRGPLYNNAPQALNVQAGNSDFEDDRVPLGQGTYDAGLIGGAGIGGSRGWGQLEVGARARSRHFSVVVPVRAQVGVKPLDRLAVYGGADFAWSLGNGEAPDFFRDQWGKGPIAIDNQRFLTASVGAALDVAHGFGATVGASRTLWAQRFPSITGVTLGAYYRFDTHPSKDPSQ